MAVTPTSSGSDSVPSLVSWSPAGDQRKISAWSYCTPCISNWLIENCLLFFSVWRGSSLRFSCWNIFPYGFKFAAKCVKKFQHCKFKSGAQIGLIDIKHQRSQSHTTVSLMTFFYLSTKNLPDDENSSAYRVDLQNPVYGDSPYTLQVTALTWSQPLHPSGDSPYTLQVTIPTPFRSSGEGTYTLQVTVPGPLGWQSLHPSGDSPDILQVKPIHPEVTAPTPFRWKFLHSSGDSLHTLLVSPNTLQVMVPTASNLETGRSYKKMQKKCRKSEKPVNFSYFSIYKDLSTKWRHSASWACCPRASCSCLPCQDRHESEFATRSFLTCCTVPCWFSGAPWPFTKQWPPFFITWKVLGEIVLYRCMLREQ